MRTYTIPAALAADWRRLPGGTRLHDAGGEEFLVPSRAVQRALGPERYVLSAEDGSALRMETLTYPVRWVVAPGPLAQRTAAVPWPEVQQALETLSQVLVEAGYGH